MPDDPRAATGPSRILYISYDGLTDPLGRSQVLPYLVGLSGLGHEITVLSCEKPERLARDAETIRRICGDAGLTWRPLPYHKSPPILSTQYDVAMLQREARRLHADKPFGIVHCRSYIAAIVGLHMKRVAGTGFVFDMRGFWPEERVDGNIWKLSNPLFRAVFNHFKRLEARFLSSADHIISLTEEGKRILLARPDTRAPITVIPCCVDFDHFALPAAGDREAARAELGIAPATKVATYLGSIGTWYMLDEMLDFFSVYRRREPGALLFFITQDEPGPILAAGAARGIPAEAMTIRPASREQVPRFLAAADFGLFFIKPVFSKKASSPTKMGELLAMGLPVVTNTGVGDVDEILEDVGGGVVTARFDEQAYEDAARALADLKPDSEGIRRRALAWFDVRTGVERYDRVYEAVTALKSSTSRGA